MVGRYVTLKHAEGFEKQCHLTVVEHTGTVRRLFIGTLAEAKEEDDAESVGSGKYLLELIGGQIVQARMFVKYF